MKTSVAFAIISILTAGASAACAFYTSQKAGRIVKKLDSKIDSISDDIDIDVQSSIVESAISKAVDKAVDAEVDKSVSWVKKDVDARVKREVTDAIGKAYPDIKRSLEEQLTEQLKDIDISSIKEDVLEKTAEIAADRFDNDLDKITTEYTNKLAKMSDLYMSVAKRAFEKPSITDYRYKKYFDFF